MDFGGRASPHSHFREGRSCAGLEGRGKRTVSRAGSCGDAGLHAGLRGRRPEVTTRAEAESRTRPSAPPGTPWLQSQDVQGLG